ncbi:tetratricopeptide repeat protein [Pseudomonas putida]|uniref:Sel1 repeat family protein n=1 Tax=Pseudomonas putida TaxID=303 RepID=A0A7V8EGA3_PSEPU|nr:hypothetical protein [Pseudomonas putida]KAF0254293.1 hypothetical protein GN299_13635 [Pseudomonas putida]
MNLSEEFRRAANLGVIAKKWFPTVEARFEQAGIVATKKTGLDAAVSLLAPAALIAQFITAEGLPNDRRLSVLVLSDDPVAIMDEGLWIGVAAELAGSQPIDVYSTCNQVIHSDHFEPAQKIGLQVYTKVTMDQARTREWDLVVWIHPAIEAGDSGQSVELVTDLASRKVPVYACMYNELDALIQSHGIAAKGFEFSWMNASVASAGASKATVNKFGIATADIGIEGGWGAVMTRLQPASVQFDAQGWEHIKVAMALYRLEGSTSGSWCVGEVLAGVSFNQCKPVGLIGNLAVDPKTGLLFAECPTTKVLNIAGHLWHDILEVMPSSQYDLVPWAARVKLAFNNQLTKEDKKRAESIELLEAAYEKGLVDAGIALARGYERIGTKDAKERAAALYGRIGGAHPMAAYYLAHRALEAGHKEQFWSMLIKAADAMYPPALTDCGQVLSDSGNAVEAGKLFIKAMNAGDAEGAFRLGESLIKAGEYAEAMPVLREAWSKNHADALNTAHWLCTEMLKHRFGKPAKLKRELKDIQFAISKRTRLTEQLDREKAKNAGDAEAAFQLGKSLIKAGQYVQAMSVLRSAWSKNHVDALNTAQWLCMEMLKHGIGKSETVRQELKDIQSALNKPTRLASQSELNCE